MRQIGAPAAYLASAALHVALLGLLSRAPPHPEGEALDVEIVRVPPPPERPAEPIRRPVLAPAPGARPAPRQVEAPPPPNQPPPPEAPPPTKAPIRIGVSLSSTTTAGAMAAPVGSSLYGKPPEKAEDPATAKPYRAERYAPPTEVTSLPVPVDVHIPDDEYPAEARRAGFEAAARILIVIDEEGRVARARVLQDPGMGLGEAAARIAQKYFRFKPARRGEETVATEIPFTVRFELR